MSDEIIKLEHIDITFHQKNRKIEAVKDVSVSINKGDIYGIVGYSGAGRHQVGTESFIVRHPFMDWPGLGLKQ